jgi:hypothetical protein
MPRVEFEPTILAFEEAKTVHALDRAATVTGISRINCDPSLFPASLVTVISWHCAPITIL